MLSIWTSQKFCCLIKNPITSTTIHKLYTTQSQILKTLKKKALKNTVYSSLSKRELVILATFTLSSAYAFNLITSKICRLLKGYTVTHH